MEKLLRIEEVADQTGLAVNTLYDYRHRGVGPRAARIGKRLAYRQRDVDEWVEAQFAKSDRKAS